LRRAVARKNESLDPMQSKLPEPRADEDVHCFRGEALTPERFPEPVTDLSALTRGIEVVQTCAAQHRSVGPPDDREAKRRAGPELPSSMRQPPEGVALGVRVRDMEGPSSHGCRRGDERSRERIPGPSARGRPAGPAGGTAFERLASKGEWEGSCALQERRRGFSERLEKLRCIREGVGCAETFRYFAEAFSE